MVLLSSTSVFDLFHILSDVMDVKLLRMDLGAFL